MSPGRDLAHGLEPTLGVLRKQETLSVGVLLDHEPGMLRVRVVDRPACRLMARDRACDRFTATRSTTTGRRRPVRSKRPSRRCSVGIEPPDALRPVPDLHVRVEDDHETSSQSSSATGLVGSPYRTTVPRNGTSSSPTGRSRVRTITSTRSPARKGGPGGSRSRPRTRSSRPGGLVPSRSSGRGRGHAG